MVQHIQNLSLLLLVLLGGCAEPEERKIGLSPDEALSTFELHPDFTIKLVASEPVISDPVDMAVDADGRLYVLEMHGYPDDRSGSDRIMMLTDADRDGRFEASTVFADSLVLPMGIMAWKKGVLVTDSPDVWYMEDTDGDGRADIRKKLLTGFHESNPEYDVNNPLYGLDNSIYLANGPTSGSEIYYPDRPDAPRIPQKFTNRNIRFNPDTFELEFLSGSTQFGQSFDTWGRHLLVSNRNHIYREAIAARYLKRNPALLISDATQSLSDHGSACEVFPITTHPNPQLLTDVGEITAACGITWYQGGRFPEGFEIVTFVAEPAHNLIHADQIKRSGSGFVASRLRPNTEFLASSDAWFRPVNMYIGPDGAIYVVDYYRQIIEGPEWLSREVLESGDLYNGSKRGRIYRITPKGVNAAGWSDVQLSSATGDQLVSRLADTNIWWRRTAQRLLVDRGDENVVPALNRLVRSSGSAVGRLHALWTLEGLENLQPELITAALQDSVSGIRENAIRLAERHLGESASLEEALLGMQSDPDPGVRYQLLLTLGFIDTPRAAVARRELLFEDIDDKWMQIAALSASSTHHADLLDRVIAQFEPEYASLVRRLSAMVAANESAEPIHRLIQNATDTGSVKREGWHPEVLVGLSRGLETRKSLYAGYQTDQDLLVRAFFKHPSAPIHRASLQVLKVIGLRDGAQTRAALQQAKRMAGDRTLPAGRRVQALDIISLAGTSSVETSFLEGLIVPAEPQAVQIAALQVLSRRPGTAVSEYVLKQWTELTPGVRNEALDTFIARPFDPRRITLLLEAVEAGKVKPASINWPQKVILMRDIADSLKFRARSLLARNEQKQQEETERYVAAVKQMTPDPERGRTVYIQHCVICHKMGEMSGVEFGPDLGSVRSWQTAELIGNIIVPNKAITRGYDLWRVELADGESLQGIIAAETPNAITLTNRMGEETTIARRNIESLQALNVSAMPTDFRDKITPRKMADLIAFIKNRQ